MMFAFKEMAIVFISVILAMLAAAGLIVVGYWMGRNTTERPFRSDRNLKRRLGRKPAEPDPEGDLFQEAVYGGYDPSKKEPGIPTIKR